MAHVEHIDARWRADTHVICAGRNVEAHDAIDTCLAHPVDDGFVVLYSRVGALR